MPADAPSLGSRLRWRLRRPFYAAYYAVSRANHERELFATRKRVGGATFRSYEPLLRHGDDALLRRLLAAVGPADTVYDVGANTGVYTLAVAAKHPDARVVAFEPDPGVRSHLAANVRANDFDNVDVRGDGVGARSGTLTFYRSTYDELGSFREDRAAAWEARVRDAVEVPVVALDDVVAAGTAPPDHLKIDVEGGGDAVVAGARDVLDTARPTVYFEPHGEDERRAVASLLTELDYEIRTQPDGWVCVPTDDSAGRQSR
ncbi:FkbM family methyltransferase [Halogeometricum limi]|uniref:Methyltransferase, FkbM family n=1 Tax=Halogeometricum limi TaxID=555875 RepID=A0A1I6GYG9_9EURY|nr:FkbM family methyltransferase [Halogeometricum limi]SFR47314.1 methyltransferase, FkbM family [Halogeometricum limi]